MAVIVVTPDGQTVDLAWLLSRLGELEAVLDEAHRNDSRNRSAAKMQGQNTDEARALLAELKDALGT